MPKRNFTIHDSAKKLTRHSWPRHKVTKVDTRKRDVVIRLTDWTDDKDEPAYDVEVYEHGIYDWNLSQSFTLREHSRKTARDLAIALAQRRLEEMVR